MTRLQYLVALEDGQWMIRYREHAYGPYKGRQSAFREAVDMAHIVSLAGGDAEVLVEWDHGQLDVEWVTGRDPYPPV